MMVSSSTRPHVRRVSTAATAALALLMAAACSADEPPPGGADSAGSDDPSAAAPAVDPPARVSFEDNVGRRGVTVDSRVTVTATEGTIDSVRLAFGDSARERVRGTLSDDGTTWRADGLLEPGQTYRLVTTGSSTDGTSRHQVERFTTENLTLDDQTYASIAPLDGAQVGVGMPVILTFDIPVTDRAAAERHLDIVSSPQVKGAWHWLSDSEVHFRPRRYWPSGAKVTVRADLNGVDVGGGIYGQESRTVNFTVGTSVISEVDLSTHTMRVFIDGELARTIPVTGGKPGFDTRSGVKVIMEKFESKRMDAATTGIDPGDPEYYNLSNVQYAMRETYSGEFIHAAPWSVGSQGSENVSHGCIGMSPEDAAWLFSRSSVGDIVVVTGTDRELEEGNGWTDWNVSWAQYREGSAL
jgi:lipoprotein-anchoring transpeptidase ErfK/SrfK